MLVLLCLQLCQIVDREAPSGELYTDGVGVITPEALEATLMHVQQQTGRQLVDKNICAVQFRMAGSKGVLARWKACDVQYVPQTQGSAMAQTFWVAARTIRCNKFLKSSIFSSAIAQP